MPAVNQVKFSVFKFKPKMLKFCQDNDIILTAYSPLARGKQMDNQLLNKIAVRYHKSAAQIMLRWGLQKGVVVIPKSQNHFRISQNIDIFDFNISPADMLKLDQLSDSV